MVKIPGVPSGSSRPSTLSAIDTALKFFGLCLLIVESLIGVLVLKSDGKDMLLLSLLATFMFVFVVMMVMILLWNKPEPLLAQNVRDLRGRVRAVSKIVKEKEDLTDTVLRKATELASIPPSPEVPPLKQSAPLRS